jgi:hypothetical protein
MTRDEWAQSRNPAAMLHFLHTKGSDRKLRLFACACCRNSWHLITDERSRHAVEVAERYADGRATDDELSDAYDEAYRLAEAIYEDVHKRAETHVAPLNLNPTDWVHGAWECAIHTMAAAGAAAGASGAPELLKETARTAVLAAVHAASPIHFEETTEPDMEVRGRAEHEHEAIQADLIRDVFGYPTRKPVPFDSAWRTDTAVALAKGIYEQQAFDRMPILADALQDAGCEDDSVLAHCRAAERHVRGCWVLDLVLGYE